MVNADGHDVVRVADRMTDVVVQELSGQQRTLHGRTTTVTVLGKPKVCPGYGILLIDGCYASPVKKKSGGRFTKYLCPKKYVFLPGPNIMSNHNLIPDLSITLTRTLTQNLTIIQNLGDGIANQLCFGK